MRTIMSLAVGFWLGRQLYIRYDQQEALEKERILKRKLQDLLKKHGVSDLEVHQHTSQWLNH